MGKFNGKVALVTGGSTGIGFATARRFAEEGAKVAIANMNTIRGEAAVEQLRANGAEAIFIPTDVSQSDQVQRMVDTTVNTLGGLNFAFNNAGIPSPMGSPLHETEEEVWDRVNDINLKGVWLSMKYEIQHMLGNGGGVIVNNSSIAGGKGMAGLSTYVASKHGLNGLTKSAALEYAEAGIRINAVMPGPVATPIFDSVREVMPDAEEMFRQATAVKRIANPLEIADAVIWLCSDESSFVTAATIPVDGGMIAV